MELVDALFHAFGLLYVSVMMGLGVLTLMAGRKMNDKKVKTLGAGLLIIGIGDCSHVIGHILADLYGGLNHEPISSPNWADAFEALSTAVSVSLATVFFLTIQLYASFSRSNELSTLDKSMMGLTAVAFIASFTNWAYLQANQGLYLKLLKVQGTLGEHPEVLASMVIAVLAMVIVGYVGCASFLKLVRERMSGADPVSVKRYQYAFWGMLLMVVAVTFVLIHPFLAEVRWAMRIVTFFKLIALMAAASLVYLGIVGPDWFVRRLERST